jgi:hypothetical protein
MIILESENVMLNQTINGDKSSRIYCTGEYLGMTPTQLKFRQSFYFKETSQVPSNPMDLEASQIITVESHIRLGHNKSEEKFIPLRMKDFGESPSPDEIKYNQGTVEFLFQSFGADVNKQTGFADGIEVNFEYIFKQVQDSSKYYKVQKWNIVS